MIFRPTLVVLSLGLALVLADVDIKMKSMKADKRNPEMARFTGACAYGPDDLDFGEEDPAAESLSMTIQFDRPVQGFKAKGVKVIANDGTNFEVTNAKPIKNGKFGVLFSATYNMTDGECPSLGGSCTDIEETEEE